MVLTPGVYHGAYFEPALLARTMGVELVEGRDLECRRGRVMMRTTHDPDPVHVIYRRNVDTWRLGDADAREEVMDRLDELVVKPVDGSGGNGIVIGPAASPAELDELRVKVMAEPRDSIAQPVVQLSTVPTFVDGKLGPRHVDLRPFAVNDGSKVWVLPGGLTLVALPEGELTVNSSRGGGSTDTWVLAGPTVAPVREEVVVDARPAEPPSSGPAITDLTGPGDQQEQQQQSRDRHHREAGGEAC